MLATCTETGPPKWDPIYPRAASAPPLGAFPPLHLPLILPSLLELGATHSFRDTSTATERTSQASNGP